MNVGSCDEGVDPSSHRRAYCRRAGIDIALDRASQSADDGSIGSPELARNCINRIMLAGRCCRKSSFYHIDVEERELPRYAKLLIRRHGASGSLLAIAKRGIEDYDTVTAVLVRVVPGTAVC
jgi:hypothetical protein